ncbi:tip elongation aberrant protein 1 isoform X3 [Rhododendron vialii]|uniref:tip elongation aberrant protein 1 isoform X3 n=1 Tax=Rhododendron vialii TaxID=182163 RepID=UPI00265EC51D|nr:tip elongation aberrant protein 1 isoform X3 [Rhododendron vialii]
MFGFSRRRTKLGRLKIHLSDSAQGTRSPLRKPKRANNSNGGGVEPAVGSSDELNCQGPSAAPELNNYTSGNSENWMVLSIAGDKPTPRFNHAATVAGNKMVVVGGESADGLLEDVQVLNFDSFSWTTASSKLYLSPTSLPLKIPACKGHSLVSWGKKVLLIGGKTDPAGDRISVWAFDTETECWSLMEAKGNTPVARCGHTVVRANSVLILFGGENSKRRKLNDLHMFDLKSLTWLPLHCTGQGPSPRSNHVAALYDDKTLLIFGGVSKAKTLNDLYSLDFETMIWSRIKIRGFHPSPRAGCCGVLFGTKWYIAGGGSRKKRHVETLIFDVVKHEWSVAVASPPSSVTTSKPFWNVISQGFSLVLVHHGERDFLVAFGGSKKEPSNQVALLILEKNESSVGRRLAPSKFVASSLSENLSSATGLATQLGNGAFPGPVDAVAKHYLASACEKHGSGRRSLSESLLVDQNPASGNVSLRKQFHNEEDNTFVLMTESSDDGSPVQVAKQKTKKLIIDDVDVRTNVNGGKGNAEETSNLLKSESLNSHNRHGNGNLPPESDDIEANNLSNIMHSDNVRLEHDVAFLKAVLDDTQKELHSTRGVLTGERARALQLQVEVFHLKQRLQSLEDRAPTPRKPYHVQ